MNFVLGLIVALGAGMPALLLTNGRVRPWAQQRFGRPDLPLWALPVVLEFCAFGVIYLALAVLLVGSLHLVGAEFDLWYVVDRLVSALFLYAGFRFWFPKFQTKANYEGR